MVCVCAVLMWEWMCAGLHVASGKYPIKQPQKECNGGMGWKSFESQKSGERENIYLSRLLLIAFYCIESRIEFVTWHENFRLDTWIVANQHDCGLEIAIVATRT